ncbi:DUF397 domain-containing protein [Actinocorallia sp. API 0066]|uniref:DUF397 domain-containing protein n=1 Tax=Actinocorallia sp. API 0066 TaxID=2896846 RepID=UPI001E549B44|nr:DUF397 domain-containing protein [Actinocorallia sp. API 0066]MCD0453100.1 DUF397 domain-containing protein [Actinocorallia sp. API 0066]
MEDLTWRRSSYTGANGGNCVELAVTWRRSSYTGANGGDCVEVAAVDDRAVAARDSKNTEKGHLMFRRAGIGAMIRSIKADRLSL